MNTELLRISKRELVFHVLFWMLLLGSLLYAWQDNQLTSSVILSRLGSWILTIVLPIYIHALILIPKYLNKTNWPKYLISVLGILIIGKILHALFLILPWVVGGFNFDFVSEFTKLFFRDFGRLDKSIFSRSMMILCISFAYRIGKDWVVNEHIKEKLTSENLSMELALLKAQLNPHFLFNVLNNIYAIALEEKAVNTADNISKLGTLMRYSLHDSQADFILLNKEIDYIERYIEMQILRMTDDDKISIEVNIGTAESTTQNIAPMILMPFIENAFKYGVSTTKGSVIKVKISFLDGVLSLIVQNVIHDISDSIASGLGLLNAESRLNLIYLNRFKLIREAREGVYHVNLEIEL